MQVPRAERQSAEKLGLAKAPKKGELNLNSNFSPPVLSNLIRAHFPYKTLCNAKIGTLMAAVTV